MKTKRNTTQEGNVTDTRQQNEQGKKSKETEMKEKLQRNVQQNESFWQQKKIENENKNGEYYERGWGKSRKNGSHSHNAEN